MRSIIILLALATTAEAGIFRRTCRTCAPATKVVVQQVAVPVAPVAFVLAPTQPSAYGAAQYRPPLRDSARQRASSATSGGDVEVLSAAILKLVDRIDALEAKFGAQVDEAGIPQIVRQHCGKCHGGEGGESGITFADIAGAMNDRAQLSVIKGSMPKVADEAEPIAPEIRQELVVALEEMRR